MADPIQILWQPATARMPNLGTRALVDVTDGDTPTVRMPIRMLSVDTPEVTAGSDAGAATIDANFVQLAAWIRQGVAPVTPAYAAYLLPLLESGAAGSLQFQQGQAASAWFKARVEERLTRPGGQRRSLFIATSGAEFDQNKRLLAYVSPNYSEQERATLTRKQRATFNLDLIESGWANPFIIYPSIPGEIDLPLLVEAAAQAIAAGLGQHGNPLSLPAYEYRACEKLHAITKKIVDGQTLGAAERTGWRSRYCADIRDRRLHGPEAYLGVPIPYRLWIWPDDVPAAIAALNLVPVL